MDFSGGLARVVLEVESKDDGTYRVWYRGVFEDGHSLPSLVAGRSSNIVMTWLNTAHAVPAFTIDPRR